MNAVLQIPPQLPAVAQAKLVLMQALSARIAARWPTASRAAIELDFGENRLSSLAAGDYEKFSLAWLIMLAEKLNARITITVE